MTHEGRETESPSCVPGTALWRRMAEPLRSPERAEPGLPCVEPSGAAFKGAMSGLADEIRVEAGRRRTFAIISHPDAGKTTLTEKLLLYGGAIHLAGSVKQRRAERHATSDWMAIERERGISIATSVLQFPYRGYQLNLLDTPGHNDFSEDTYRTLAAADCAVMLIDSAKGVEPQTIKLFEVCRMRRIPIVTFINKMDRHGRDPLDLLDEIERVLGMPVQPGQLADRRRRRSSRASTTAERSRLLLLRARRAGGAQGGDAGRAASTIRRCAQAIGDARPRPAARRARAAARRRHRLRRRARSAPAS